MNFQLTNAKIIQYVLLSLLLVFVAINATEGYRLKELSMLICLVSTVVLIYKARHEVGSLIIFIFLLYSMVMISYEFLFGVKTAVLNFYYQKDYYNQVICLLAFFIASFALFYRGKVKIVKIEKQLDGNNKYLFLAAVALCFYILIFGVSRGVFTSYSVRITSIYEYFILFFMLAFFYSAKTWRTNLFLMAMAAVYILQDFYYGGRISSLQLMILIAALFFNQIKLRHLIVLSVVGYIMMNIVELYRNRQPLNLSSIISSINVINGSSYKANTFSEVLYSSSALVYSSTNIFTSNERLGSFIDFIRNTFNDNQPKGNIIAYISQNVSYVGGGGFFPAYFYFWFGWGGVFASTWAAIRVLNADQYKTTNVYYSFIKIMAIAMFPRWFVYTPLIFTRFVILNFTLMYLLFFILDNMTRRYARTGVQI